MISKNLVDRLNICGAMITSQRRKKSLNMCILTYGVYAKYNLLVVQFIS